MINSQNLNQILQNLPKKPGVYRFYNFSKDLLYIGKAKNLKNRVSSYFAKNVHSERITLMISQIEKIEYSETKTEKEALLLEASLVFARQPKYNILLKEEQNHFYIRTGNTEIVNFTIVRKKFDPNSTYFGPFLSYSKAHEILQTVRSIFPFCQVASPFEKARMDISIAEIDQITNLLG